MPAPPCTACGPCCCCVTATCICSNCCANFIGATLFGTITNINNCGCLPGACVFHWDGVHWVADLGACCGDTDRSLTLACNVTNWNISGARNGGAGGSWFNGFNCSDTTCCPFLLDVDISPDKALGPGPTCQLSDAGKFHLKITWP